MAAAVSSLERTTEHVTIADVLSWTRLVKASALPATFRILTTWHVPAIGTARKVGRRILVRCMGVELLLAPSQRVRIVVEVRS